MIKRSNDNTNQGSYDKSAARGQTLRSFSGKDSSDYSGPASKEETSKLKMGGGIHDYSKVKGQD